MRLLPTILLACLLGASGLAAAQTVDGALAAIEKKDYEKARVMLEKLSVQGNAEAEFRLAEMYVRPIGIPRNVQRGVTLYESAVRENNAEAQFVYANELLKGEIVPADRKRALA